MDPTSMRKERKTMTIWYDQKIIQVPLANMICICWCYMEGCIIYMFEIPWDDQKLGASAYGWCFFHNIVCKGLRTSGASKHC
jgi:hypothetical protein